MNRPGLSPPDHPVSLVAGAAGFLGSHLVDRLLWHGHRVVGLDNLCTGSLDNLQNALTYHHDRFDFVHADITACFELPHYSYNYIWHLASPASPVDYRRLSLETLGVNSLGTKNMLDLAVQHQASFLLASTSEAYGDPQVHPQPETYWGSVNPVGERACYDEGKRFAEALTAEYRRCYGLNARIIRIFNTYGPRMQITDGRAVPNFICQALGGQPLTVYGSGRQTRSFIFVSDQIEGILRSMFEQQTNGEIINLGNPDEYTILELAEAVAKICGVEFRVVYQPLPPDDPTRRCPDISKARALLGWEPVTVLDRGMAITVDYFARALNKLGRCDQKTKPSCRAL